MLRCIFGPNLVILVWMADELWCEQAQNEVKFDFQVKFDLEDQGRASPKTIGTGQARDWYTHTHIHTHGHTDPQTQAMTIPEGQNWPRVKMQTRENVRGIHYTRQYAILILNFKLYHMPFFIYLLEKQYIWITKVSICLRHLCDSICSLLYYSVIINIYTYQFAL